MTRRLTYAGTCMGHQPKPSDAPNGWLHNAMPSSCLLIPAFLTACHRTTIWAENYLFSVIRHGAIDPLGDLAEVAREHGAWFHVDGAYGLIAAASPTLRPAFTAVADADSVIVDPHKWLATGVGCAATYVRDAGLLLRAFAQGAAVYLESSFSSGEHEAVVQFDSIGIPTWTWVSSCPHPAAACWPGRCCANWAAPVSRPGWDATSGSPATWPSGRSGIRAWNCCSSRSCRSSASATPPATPSTPRSSCGSAAPPARYHLQRSSEATWPSGPASSTPTPGWR